MTPALKVLGKEDVARAHDMSLSQTGFEFENAGSDEDQLSAGCVVIILVLTLRGFAKKNRIGFEYVRGGTTIAFQGHLPDFNGGITRGQCKDSMNDQNLSRIRDRGLCVPLRLVLGDSARQFRPSTEV